MLVRSLSSVLTYASTVRMNQGWSSVHIAAAYNHIYVLGALLALDVSVNEPDSRLGYTPLHLAASVDNVAVLECLFASGRADFGVKARNVRLGAVCLAGWMNG